MPWLDVSEVVGDPELADVFRVIRRPQTVDTSGVPQVGEIDMGEQVGVITYADPSDLMRRDDSQTVPRTIFFATVFRVRGVSKGFNADQLEFPPGSGTLYTVKQIYPYSRYGAGVIEGVAESMDATDQAPT